MPGGRPAKHNRSPFGERLVAARLRAGRSQAQVAEQMGISQQSYAEWERSTPALRPEQVATLATFLDTTTDELFGREIAPRRGAGPEGKLRQVFDQAAELPRDQQKHIVRLVEDAMTAYRTRQAKTSTAA